MNLSLSFISIIIVSYNNSRVLVDALNTIHTKIKSFNFEIVIIDNASTENNVKLIEQKFPDIKIIQNSENKGFGYACNQGAKVSTGDFLLFVNSDVIFRDDPLPDLMRIYNLYNDVGIVGCKLLNNDGSIQTSYYSDPTLTKRFLDLSGLKKLIIKYKTNKLVSKYTKVDIIKGAFLLVKKDLFVKLSGFDENYFMYVEDVDLSFRARKNGYNNYIVNNDSVIHLGWHPPSIDNLFAFYNGNVGLKYFYKKNKNKFIYLLFLLVSIPLLFLKYLYYYSEKEKKAVLKKLLKKYLKSETNTKPE